MVALLDKLAAELSAGPMPRHVKPMLATLAPMPDRQEQFAFEYKWDGVRAIAYWDGRRLSLESRNLKDVTPRYPELSPLGEALGGRQVVLDGEIIALDPQGRISFGQLQHRMHLTRPDEVNRLSRRAPVTYMIFDVLYLDEYPLFSLGYRRRRELLEGLQLGRGPAWRLSPFCAGDGSAILESAQSNLIEGVMAKRLDSPYLPGRRSDDWLKVKVIQRQEFVIGGWLPIKGDHPEMIGSLLVGYYPDDGGPDASLIYCGSVGTGYSDQQRRDLRRLLEPDARASSPFSDPRPKRDARFVEPRHVAEVEFREWTQNDSLRHPSFKGLRDDKRPREVVRERPKASWPAKS